MPRPKADPDALYIRELRITPPDGLPITDWNLNEDFKVAIIAQEGGTDDVRLHYHAYIESFRSESWIKKWIYSIAHCTNGESGNTVFFSRKPHDNTIGYVVKHGDVVVRHGCTQTYIDEWLAKSAQYCKDKESSRKRRQRVDKAFTHTVLTKVVDDVKTDSNLRNPESIMNLILAEYREAKRIYPSRTQVENMIVTIMHPYNSSIVRAFYLRAFDYQ